MTGDDLLRSILLTPEDDLPRLVYADFLEEQGETERAEFIRVQIELARMGNPFSEADDSRHDILRRRERKLLKKNWARWDWCLDVVLGADDKTLWLRTPGENHPLLIVRRGFIEVVTCSLRDWCGGVCGFCRQGRALGYDGEWNMPCIDCHGTGRIGGHGPAIAAVQPVMEVLTTDGIVWSENLPPSIQERLVGRESRAKLAVLLADWARTEAFKETAPIIAKEHHDAT